MAAIVAFRGIQLTDFESHSYNASFALMETRMKE